MVSKNTLLMITYLVTVTFFFVFSRPDINLLFLLTRTAKFYILRNIFDRLSALQVRPERPLGIAKPSGSSQESGVPAHNLSGTPNGFTDAPTSLSLDVSPMTHGSGGES